MLSLPNELFLSYIFIHLDLTDLIELFDLIHNRRLRALLSASLSTRTYIDLTQAKVSNEWILSKMSFIPAGNQIVTLQINDDQLNKTSVDVIVNACPKLSRMEVIVRQDRSLFSILSTMELDSLKLSSICGNQDEMFVYLCHSQCTLHCLTITEDKPIRTLSVELLSHCNRRLTHLSIAVLDLGVAASLMCHLLALEKLELRLPHRNQSTTRNPREYRHEDHPLSYQWSTRLRFLSIVAPRPYTRIYFSFYDFVRRFSSSLQQLSFYLTPLFRAMTPQALERELLAQLPRLTRLDFCIHTGLTSQQDNDARHLFDRWASDQRHVISIYHNPGMQHSLPD